MENIEERLRRLEAADCKVCGFTVDNVGPGFQDRFIALLPEAKNLEVLALTRLLPLNEIEDEWRRGQAENYRREKKIADSPERAAYFYARTLPRLLNILPALPELRELCLFNINLSEEQRAALPEVLKLLT